ncbi:MAG: GTP 3',8-cyclase MoaA [Bradymonadaceae bacterium]
MDALTDTFGRRHDTLRLSVTDRCNLRCRYCMPEDGVPSRDRQDLLSFEELAFVVGVARKMGIDRVRLTGGEPLLRRDLPEFVEMLDRGHALDDLAMTTNGLLLARRAEALAEAGLDRVNVSLDSLDPETYRELTRHGDLEEVARGLEAAHGAGLTPIKLNVLALKGVNDGEFDQWVEVVRDRNLTVRFMELMPIGEAGRQYGPSDFVDLSAVRERLVDRYGMEPAVPSVGNGPARYWCEPGADGKLGFITPLSHPYCSNCSRLRMDAMGRLRPCLAYDRGVELGEAARARDDSAVEAGIRRALDQKPRGHRWNEGETTEAAMSRVGG